MPNTRFLGKRPKNTVARLQQLRKDADKVGDTDTRDKLGAMIVEQGGTVPDGDIPKGETKMSRLERLRIEAIDCGDTDSAAKLAELIAEEQTGEPTPDKHTETALQAARRALDQALGSDSAPEERAELHKTYDMEVKKDDLRERLVDAANENEYLSEDEVAFLEGGPIPKYPNRLYPAFTEDELSEMAAEESHAPHEGRNLVDKPKEVHAGLKFKAPVVVPSSLDQGVHTPPESNEERLEGPEAVQAVNDGNVSVNAAARIKKEGWRLDEIPARFGGKVDMTDVKNYKKLLTAV